MSTVQCPRTGATQATVPGLEMDVVADLPWWSGLEGHEFLSSRADFPELTSDEVP